MGGVPRPLRADEIRGLAGGGERPRQRPGGGGPSRRAGDRAARARLPAEDRRRVEQRRRADFPFRYVHEMR